MATQEDSLKASLGEIPGVSVDTAPIIVGVAFDAESGMVRVDFDCPVEFLDLSPSAAINLARTIAEKAGATIVDIA